MEVYSEIPDEITLAINIANCPIQCPDCHSKELWKDTGKDLTQRALERMIREHDGISCVCFMGGDAEPEIINMLGAVVQTNGLKSAWYSGRDKLPLEVCAQNFNFIKLGPFIKEKGPINKPTTNQRLYEITDKGMIDITHRLWT